MEADTKWLEYCKTFHARCNQIATELVAMHSGWDWKYVASLPFEGQPSASGTLEVVPYTWDDEIKIKLEISGANAWNFRKNLVDRLVIGLIGWERLSENKHYPLPFSRHRITVAANRRLDSIATDILRRIVNVSKKTVEEAVNRQIMVEQRDQWLEQARQTLCIAQNHAQGATWQERENDKVISRGLFDITAELDAYNQRATVTIEGIPLDMAAKLFAMQQPQAQPEDN